MIKAKALKAPSPEEIEEALTILRRAGAQFVLDDTLEPELCTVHQVAEMLSVEPAWVRQHLKEFPKTVRLQGGELRIPYTDIEAAIQRWRIRSITAPGVTP
jgi:predicted DNA-binding transcriptional regulator AlpA